MTQPRPSQMVTRKQLAVIVILIVIAGFFTNFKQFQQANHITAKSHARDIVTRNQDEAICLFASLFPRPTIPAADLPKYDRAVALAHCSMFSL